MTVHFCNSLTDKAKVAEFIRASDKPLAVDIQEGDIRTIKANSRYWAAVVTSIQNHWERMLGQKYSKEAVHHYLKVERYGKKVDEINGKIYERCARSSKMTPKQFAKFTEWAEAHAINDLGVDPIEIDGHARGADL